MIVTRTIIHTPFIMTSESKRLPDGNSLLSNCTKFGALKANQIPSFKKSSGNEESIIAGQLSQLPKIKSRPGFDQKMAAAFAMELEKETLQRNRSWLKKSKNISLPDIITDFM